MQVTYLFFFLVGIGWSAWAPGRGQTRDYNAAVEALEAGELAEAEAIFRRVLEKDPACGLAQHGLGMALLRQNEASEAMLVLGHASEVYPGQEAVHVGLSLAAFASQDFGRAQAAAREAVRLSPGSIDAVAALVGALLRQGSVEAAQEVVTAARGNLEGPSLACLEAQVLAEAGQPETARQRLAYCNQSRRPELAAAVAAQLGASVGAASAVGAERLVQLSRAVELVNAGQHGEAIGILDPIAAADGRRADVRLIRARARLALGDRDGARADLEVAFSGETWVDVHRSGAMSGILRQSHAEALQVAIAEGAALLVQIHLEDGQVTAAQQRLSAAKAALGDSRSLDLAEARLLQATGAAPDGWAIAMRWSSSPQGLDLMGEWAVAEPGSVPDEALAALAASGRWSDRYNLAVVAYNRRDYPRCLEVTAQAAETTMDPAHLKALWGLGYRCAVFSGVLEDADRLLQRLSVEALREADRVNHARLRYQAGQPAEVLALLEGLADPGVQGLASSLAMRASVDLERWDEAVRWAPGASAQDRYWLGGRLAEAGEHTAARAVLSAACGQLDAEASARCAQLLEQLDGVR